MQEPNQYYGMAALLDQPLHPKDGLVVQYEVKFSEGHKCGGAYLKLLSAPADGSDLVPEKLKAKTPFTVMFGPDK
jgi:calnexin